MHVIYFSRSWSEVTSTNAMSSPYYFARTMREVSVRILHFAYDLAHSAGIDEKLFTEGLPSLAPVDGKEPDWIDWDEFIEAIERLEKLLGGPEGQDRAFRDIVPTGYPELRGFAAIFVRPIPLFKFVMTRFMRTMYRNITVEEVEELDGERVRWTQTIPEPFRASECFHRGTKALAEVFPLHLDLPEAQVESMSITPRVATFVVAFPPAASMLVRSSRAVAATSSALAAQVDEAFATIGDALRGRPFRTSGIFAAGTVDGDGRAWPERLSLSPRQRDVFALLVEGRANKDIATLLRCSERNVEFHVGRILKAARVTSRAELLVKVLAAK